VVHLGTYVWPRTPFPYFAPVAVSAPSPQEKENAGAKEPVKADKDQEKNNRGKEKPSPRKETRVTIVIPSGFLPEAGLKRGLVSERAGSDGESPGRSRARIWGGGLVHGHGDAVMGGGPKERDAPKEREKRVYTDDSDLLLCAVHCGLVSWAEVRRARARGEDVRVEVRVLEGWRKFVGGWGAAYGRKRRSRKREREEEGEEDEDGRKLMSAGWGSGHDGAAIEILKVDFVKVRFGCVTVPY
jgi:hypothetical protein